MTKGLIRIYGQKHLHFITFSTFRRAPTLTPNRRTHVLQQLEAVREQKKLQVCGYVVMPEHVHILIGEPEIGTPSTVMQLLKQRCSAAFNSESRTRGSQFWQSRFYDFNVVNHKKRVEKLRYMHNNPVTRGLVDHAKGLAMEQLRLLSWARTRTGGPRSILIPPFARLHALRVGHPAR